MFLSLKSEGPEHFRDVSGRGRPGGAAGGQGGPGPDAFKKLARNMLSLLKPERPEYFRGVSGKGGQAGPAPDAIRKVV